MITRGDSHTKSVLPNVNCSG